MSYDGSIFPTWTLDRKQVLWEDFLETPTPCEMRRGHWYKREDAFAPLGPSGPNGNKMRHLIWLVKTAMGMGRVDGLLTGGSVQAPQLARSAVVGAYYGLPVHIVLGGTRLDSARRHVNVAISEAAGATFSFAKVGYNPAIQREIATLHGSSAFKHHYRVPYGISTPEGASDWEVSEYHLLSARQVQNIPEQVTRLLVPMGSANTVASLLLGLALWPPPHLSNVTLFGIGPNRLKWLDQRLRVLKRAIGVDVRSQFRRTYWHDPQLAEAHDADIDEQLSRFRLEHYDLHGSGWCTYQDKRPYHLDGIDFHSTYEGKILAYMQEMRGDGLPYADRFEDWWGRDSRVLFWIVGSDATLEGTMPYLPHRNERTATARKG